MKSVIVWPISKRADRVIFWIFLALSIYNAAIVIAFALFY